MKLFKKLKLLDLVFSIIFLILFFYENRITASYEYGLGQLIQLFVLIPVIISLLASVILSIIAIFDKNNVFAFSIIGQVLKIISYLLNIVIRKFLLEIAIKVDFVILIFIYGMIALIIFIVLSISHKKQKVNN